MANRQEDLIDFEVIEGHKENIQSLPSGRSAKALAALYSPPLTSRPNQLNETQNEERLAFEQEVVQIDEADDPLDVYDRYIKWTLNNYPSVQSTSSSQLLPLLERATKTFLTSTHVHNDARYVKMWLQYIKYFHESPRETYIFMARNGIGEGLALFYEEYAAWLESSNRWTQAEEVYIAGINKGARPLERLNKKYAEFEARRQVIPADVALRPDSPALPIERPALASKVDPFSSASQSVQKDASNTAEKSKKKNKMAIFSDESAQTQSAMGSQNGESWNTLQDLQAQKRENNQEPTTWTGQTLKVGKTNAGMEKLAVFRSPPRVVTKSNKSNLISQHEGQSTINERSGRREHVFVNLSVLYPSENQVFSFEQVMARSRGWIDRDWRDIPRLIEQKEKKTKKRHNGFEIFQDENIAPSTNPIITSPVLQIDQENISNSTTSLVSQIDQENVPIKTIALNDENGHRNTQRQLTEKEAARRFRKEEEKANRTRKIKMIPVRTEKKETQTIRLNMDSPTGPKIKRKKTAEPTMTVNTFEAMNEIYDIYGQAVAGGESEEEEEEEENEVSDDDYTSGAESTTTGKISITASEYGDETRNEIFQAQNGVEQVAEDVVDDDNDQDDKNDATGWTQHSVTKDIIESLPVDNDQDVQREDLATPGEEKVNTRYIPLTPEDYEPRNMVYRDRQNGGNRLPFMTPIVEHTESSIGTSRTEKDRDYFSSRTPCRIPPQAIQPILEDGEDVNEIWSSPFQEEIVDIQDNDKENVIGINKLRLSPIEPLLHIVEGPLIKDDTVNPMDPVVRETVLTQMTPSLSSYPGFHDHRLIEYNRLNDIRKYAKAISKKTASSDKTISTLTLPPMLDFPDTDSVYTIKKELGAGTFAPVYLVERHCNSEEEDDDSRRESLEAMKIEPIPSAWEFHILRLCYRLLSSPSSSSSSLSSDHDHQRAIQSIIPVHELHLYSNSSFLIESFSDTGTLVDLVNLSKNIDSCSGGVGAGLEESLVMFYTIELFRTIESLHKVGIIHGDMKADNILLRLLPSSSWSSPYDPSGSFSWSNHGILLIDFGRGINTSDFIPTARFFADWELSEADCIEMREARPWKWQIDYHGLANVVHTLLFGKYISILPERSSNDLMENSEKKWRQREGLKRYWKSEVWNEVFGMLLNSNSSEWQLKEKNARGELNDMDERGFEKEGMLALTSCMKTLRIKMERHLVGIDGTGVVNGEGAFKARLRKLEEAVVGNANKKRVKT